METSIYKEVGENIRRIRKKLELTQDDLSQQLTLTRTAITHIEAGTQGITLLQLSQIATALNSSILELLPKSLLEQQTSVEQAISNTTLESKNKELLLDLVRG
jgi:transcriptional regulator with XRE-family HTH domain